MQLAVDTGSARIRFCDIPDGMTVGSIKNSFYRLRCDEPNWARAIQWRQTDTAIELFSNKDPSSFAMSSNPNVLSITSAELVNDEVLVAAKMLINHGIINAIKLPPEVTEEALQEAYPEVMPFFETITENNQLILI